MDKEFNEKECVGFEHFVELKFVFHFPAQLPPYSGTVLCGPQDPDELPDGKLVLSFVSPMCFLAPCAAWAGSSLFGSHGFLLLHTFPVNVP